MITIRNPTIHDCCLLGGSRCQPWRKNELPIEADPCVVLIPSCLHHHRHTLGMTSGTKCLAYAVSSLWSLNACFTGEPWIWKQTPNDAFVAFGPLDTHFASASHIFQILQFLLVKAVLPSCLAQSRRSTQQRWPLVLQPRRIMFCVCVVYLGRSGVGVACYGLLATPLRMGWTIDCIRR